VLNATTLVNSKLKTLMIFSPRRKRVGAAKFPGGNFMSEGLTRLWLHTNYAALTLRPAIGPPTRSSFGIKALTPWKQ
jgi:hypothetical protein